MNNNQSKGEPRDVLSLGMSPFNVYFHNHAYKLISFSLSRLNNESANFWTRSSWFCFRIIFLYVEFFNFDLTKINLLFFTSVNIKNYDQKLHSKNELDSSSLR